eukprot:scaffold17672_cov111-Isochrysis_galbana.AAC.2
MASPGPISWSTITSEPAVVPATRNLRGHKANTVGYVPVSDMWFGALRRHSVDKRVTARCPPGALAPRYT